MPRSRPNTRTRCKGLRVLLAQLHEPDTSVSVTNVLTDLRHFCYEEELDFALLDKRAAQHYYNETKGDPR